MAFLLLATGCEPEVTSTFAEGTVRGISLPAAAAVSAADTDILGGHRQTVWISSGLVCSVLRSAPLGEPDAFGPSFVGSPAGGVSTSWWRRMPALILTSSGGAFFDTGVEDERLRGTSKLWLEKTASNGTFSARFTATFAVDGGTAETISGDFIATPCASASPGCSGAPGLFLVGALLLARRRRR